MCVILRHTVSYTFHLKHLWSTAGAVHTRVTLYGQYMSYHSVQVVFFSYQRIFFSCKKAQYDKIAGSKKFMWKNLEIEKHFRLCDTLKWSKMKFSSKNACYGKKSFGKVIYSENTNLCLNCQCVWAETFTNDHLRV